MHLRRELIGIDFLDRVQDQVNELSDLHIQLFQGYLGTDDSFVVYPRPGSRITQEFMDGTTDQQLNFDFAMKSKSQKKIHDTLWLVQNKLEQLEELNSDDGSIEFKDLIIMYKNFINDYDTQCRFVFLLNIQVNLTVLYTIR